LNQIFENILKVVLKLRTQLVCLFLTVLVKNWNRTMLMYFDSSVIF